jgi:hypothetical protein
LIFSLSLLYSVYVSVFLGALARRFLVTVDTRAVVTKLNLELILFILVLIPRVHSSLFFSTLLAFIFPYSFQSLALSHLLYSVDSSPFFSLAGLCNCFSKPH